MRRFAAATLALCLWIPGESGARSEFVIGGDGGNRWPVLLEGDQAGVYLIIDGQGTRQVPVATTPFGESGESLIDFVNAEFPASILPRFFDPTVNMTLADLTSNEVARIPFPYTGGFATTTDGCAVAGQHTPVTKPMYDGDPSTAQFRRITLRGNFTGDPVNAPLSASAWPGGTVIDFGAAVPVNRIRLYPRLSRTDDALLIQDMAEPRPPIEAFGEDSFIANLVGAFELRVGDGSFLFAKNSCDVEAFSKGLRWILTRDTGLEVLHFTEENLDIVTDLRFPTRSIRYMTFKTFPLENWEVAEFEVYGEGFVRTTTYRTQILDFGSEVNWGKIRWSGDLPEGTRVEIRTRMGNTEDPQLFFEETVSGAVIPISRQAWEESNVTSRLDPVINVDQWSFWSPPYDFGAGLRDASTPAEAWEDGTPLLSRGPSRYIQIDIRLFSTFTRAPRIDQLWLQFSPTPLAREVVGEIWPIEVDSFQPVSFTYVVRPEFETSHLGFDRLEILTHSRVEAVSSVVIDGNPVDQQAFPPEIQNDRLIVPFPALRGEGDSFKQIEVTFEVPVLRYGTEFRGWVFNSQLEDQVRQQVGAGNATFRFSGNVLAVSTPLQGDLLVDLQASSDVITPNGDGINDDLVLSFKLRQLTLERPVRLRIFDASGRLVVELEPQTATSGAFSQRWTGLDSEGEPVPPGNYVYELDLSAEQRERRHGVVAVAY